MDVHRYIATRIIKMSAWRTWTVLVSHFLVEATINNDDACLTSPSP